jgi:hypothetical protein
LIWRAELLAVSARLLLTPDVAMHNAAQSRQYLEFMAAPVLALSCMFILCRRPMRHAICRPAQARKDPCSAQSWPVDAAEAAQGMRERSTLV